MYGPPGHAYVYLVYGMYDCLNVVTEPRGHPAAVLIRALRPLAGVDAMREARLELARRRLRGVREDPARERIRLAALPDERVASGPGLVAAAFGLRRDETGVDLCDPGSAVRLEGRPASEPAPRVAATPRVGIAYAGAPWRDVPWRFLIPDDPAVSGPRPRR
jgi:DNA-3-methyladenine glycosylase